MKIIFTIHLETILYFRGIDGFRVKEVAKDSSWKEARDDGTIKARKDFDGKTLEVVYIEYPGKRVIKTAYYVN